MKRLRVFNIALTVLLSLCFILLGVFCFNTSYLRLLESLGDLWQSVKFYGSKIFGFEYNGVPSVTEFSEVMKWNIFLPEDLSAFKEQAGSYFKLLFSAENLSSYGKFVGELLLAFMKIFAIALPCIVIFILLLKRLYKNSNNNYNKDTVPLRVFKWISNYTYQPIKRCVTAYKKFLKDHNFIWILWLILWAIQLNLANTVISVIQNSLKTAHILGLTPVYEANKIKRPKPKEKQIECFTISEQKKIEQAVSNSKKSKLYGIIICLYTGLRIGELLALEWSDIDFEKGILSITKSCHDANKNGVHCRVVEHPKTENSRRIIPLPKQLMPILKDLKRKSTSNFIIADKDAPVFVRSYQRSFELLLVKLDIPHRGFHSLRHTFATRAIECGMDIKTLSEILGHKNSIITLNRYAHSLLEHKSEMMNKLGKLL